MIHVDGRMHACIHLPFHNTPSVQAPTQTDNSKADSTPLLHAHRKDRLKKNPVVSNDELNQVSGGLGDEAAKEFGKGGLGKGIGKAFD